MLRQRILTALILVPLVVLSLFALPPAAVALLLGGFVLGAAWEWAGLIGLAQPAGRLLYVLAVGLAGALAWLAGSVLPILVIGVSWWVWSLFELLYVKDLRQGVFGSRLGRMLSGILILVPAWLASFHLHAADPRSPAALLFLFVLVWVADSAAYFAGHAFGRTKLAPHVSPGKTLEGLVGAVAAVLVLAALAGLWIWDFAPVQLGLWMAVATATVLVSALGDLVESRAKRIAGVKDSGALLPGHGGIFDRIDAFTAAAPVFALGTLGLMQAGQ